MVAEDVTDATAEHLRFLAALGMTVRVASYAYVRYRAKTIESSMTSRR